MINISYLFINFVHILVKLCLGSLKEKLVLGFSWTRSLNCLVILLSVSKLFFITKFLNDVGNKSCSKSYINNEACSLNTSTIFSIFADLYKGSVWLLYHFLLIILNARFCKISSFFVFPLPQACIPYVIYDCELEYNIMILVIYVVRYVSPYLFQKWLEIFSSWLY